MRIIKDGTTTKLWLSARDTYIWAHKIGAGWPCSRLSGHSLFAEFDKQGDLINIDIDGFGINIDCPADEFNAITTDFLLQD